MATIIVKESHSEIDPDDFLSYSTNITQIKLRCHKSKLDNMYFLWQHKRCGESLKLPNCNDPDLTSEWSFQLCRNHSQPCVGSTLTIEQPTELDSGLYRCLHKHYMITEDEYSINKIISLNVQDERSRKLEILEEIPYDDNQTVSENDTVVFRCRVRSIGIAPPNIFWFKEPFNRSDPNSFQLPKNKDKYEVLPAVNKSQFHRTRGKIVHTSKFHIKNVKPDDAGTYLCYAFNYHYPDYNETKKVFLRVISSNIPKAQSFEDDNETWLLVVIPVFFVIAIALFGIFALCFYRKRLRILRQSLENCSKSHQSLNF